MKLFDDAYAPAFFRFIMELSSWAWMLLIFYFFRVPAMLIYALISIFGLALLNVPGDKQPKEDGVLGLTIPGKVRVLLELATATMGLIAAIIMPGILMAIFQLFIIIGYLYLDGERLSWMWGRQTFPPRYVTKLHEDKAKHEK